MKINANASGTRTIEVTEEQLQIIRKYSLLDRIANSTGVIDEESLNNLHFAAAIAFILMIILLTGMTVVKYVSARYVYGGE